METETGGWELIVSMLFLGPPPFIVYYVLSGGDPWWLALAAAPLIVGPALLWTSWRRRRS